MKSPIHRKNYKIELFSPKNYLLKVFLLLRNEKKYYAPIDAYEISAMNKTDYKSSTCLEA